VRPVREATLLIAERAWQPADWHEKAAGGLRERERERVREVGDTGVRAGGRAILLERRPSPGIWGGLWSPPQFEGEAAAMAWAAAEFGAALDGVQRLDPIRHAFTHFELTLHPVRVRLSLEGRGHAAGAAGAAGVREGAGDRLWYALDDPPRVGLPQPIRDLIGRLERRGVGDAEAAVAPFLGEQARLKG
jgi:A/G-specific adenine glycosylase